MNSRTNNPKGRPKGKPNKVTQEVRQAIKDILEKRASRLPALLDTLGPKDELEMFVKLAAFIIPKPVMREEDGDEFDKTVSFG